MAWNQPGRRKPGSTPGGNGDRPPWGRGGPGRLPPGLEAALQWLNDVFGGGVGPARLLLLAALALLLLFMAAGWHAVGPGEQALVLRGGRLQALQSAGWYWNPPLLDRVRVVNVAVPRTAVLSTEVVTRDEALASVELDLQYRVADPVAYLLQFDDAESALLHVTESVLQEQSAGLSWAELAGPRPPGLARRLQQEVEARLARYHAGLELTGLSLTSVLPSAEVRAAFEEVQRAREERGQRLADTRKALRQELQGVRIQADRELVAATADQAEALRQARRDSEGFHEALAAYRTQPEATLQRLYQDALAAVLADTRTVILGEKGLESLGIAPSVLQQPSALPPPPERRLLPRGTPP